MQWLKHAFAVDSAEPVEPDEAQRVAAEALCRQVVRRHLTTPALVCLESLRPLNYLIAQGMHATMPFLSLLSRADGPRKFATFLEHRGSFEYLCRRIEQLEAEATLKDLQAEGGERSAETRTTPADGRPADPHRSNP